MNREDIRRRPPAEKTAPKKKRDVPISWEALEDAFENNAPEVHSYLHLPTGEVIRIVEGVADAGMFQRVTNDPEYLRVDPVSSREQYRWMERYIATVGEGEYRKHLLMSIDGKGAFRRFKDVLMNFPVERERWFSFRSERLRACMEQWLDTHGLTATERPKWEVPTVEEVESQLKVEEKVARKTKAVVADTHRARLHELTDALPARELDAAVAFLEFLKDRKHIPRPTAKVVEMAKPSAENE